MKTISSQKLLALAGFYNKKGISWHHHFLPPSCLFNKEKKFLIILENDETSDAYVMVSDKKPALILKRLEALFFGKKR
ncbi:hypothetical protein HZC31_08065 [Candidatus Woesearchaeota archaeon]|nr:hypothetical protein [Candidatus Woesearchaeota archaeon]